MPFQRTMRHRAQRSQYGTGSIACFSITQPNLVLLFFARVAFTSSILGERQESFSVFRVFPFQLHPFALGQTNLFARVVFFSSLATPFPRFRCSTCRNHLVL